MKDTLRSPLAVPQRCACRPDLSVANIGEYTMGTFDNFINGIMPAIYRDLFI